MSRADIEQAFRDLRADLILEGGPQISTMRNYRYAMLVYEPELEFALRVEVQQLVTDLKLNGWVVKTLSLQKLLVGRLRALGEETLARMIGVERSTADQSLERGLNYARDRLARLCEGPNGIAADVVREIDAFAKANADALDRSVVLVGRAGALYPFARLSALLKHIDGRTHNVPVVLLYPGKRLSEGGLSFMGKLEADRDYRPRIYPGSLRTGNGP